MQACAAGVGLLEARHTALIADIGGFSRRGEISMERQQNLVRLATLSGSLKRSGPVGRTGTQSGRKRDPDGNDRDGNGVGLRSQEEAKGRKAPCRRGFPCEASRTAEADRFMSYERCSAAPSSLRETW